MRILVVGGGGREHALAWKLSQEAEVHCAPGNPGIAEDVKCHAVPAASISGIGELCLQLHPDLVVVGPEYPLIAGMADHLHHLGFPVFGPCANAAQLEGSKAFSKRMMREAGVPTAEFQAFTGKVLEAKAYAASRLDAGFGVAVKASGNALGKGVVVCETLEEASEALDSMMVDREFGEAGETVVVEDRLCGREFSLLVVASGENFVALPPAQDYKRALDGDRGPNTGGMGSVSPVAWLSDDLVALTVDQTVRPMLRHLSQLGIEFRGTLFCGLMVQEGVPYCLEYNVRFGDPETQSVMQRLGGGFAELLLAAACGGSLSAPEVRSNAAVTVVAASGGYPGSYAKGKPITLTSFPEGVKVFHAGTALHEGQLVTSGGRVLAVSAVSDTVETARELAYEGMGCVQFEGMSFRTDIARYARFRE